MAILKSEFKNSNIEEIKKNILSKNITTNKNFNFEIRKNSLPELTFFDNNEIKAGYYDFEIDSVRFQNCWIQPHSKAENEPIKYVSGSYYAIYNL